MVYLGMKRERNMEGEIDTHTTLTSMANYLMLLSRGGSGATSPVGRAFECKTCNRQFSSFQALGGHRASHKRPRLMAGELGHQAQSPPKPKSHECPICGLEFAVGQALGGHMRRHKVAAVAGDRPDQVAVVKKSSSMRVLCLDLKLGPPENSLDFQREKVGPMLHRFS